MNRKKRVSSARGARYDVGMDHYETVAKAIRRIESSPDGGPSLAELARASGLSPHHFHRVFARWAGVTPKALQKHLAGSRVKALLRGRSAVLDASYEAGLSGPGRAHDLLVAVEGVTPGEYKSGGAGLEIRWGVCSTPFGAALAGVTTRGVCHFAFIATTRAAALAELRRAWPRAVLREDPAAARAVATRAFGRGRRRLKVLLAGTPFQLKVWEALLRIPPGETTSYGRLAARAGAPRAARAVGAAVGANRVGWIIPCHRVLREAGALGGYRWGTERKRAMLVREAVV